MNAISGSILLLLLLVVVFAPRRWALLGIATGLFFLTQGHSVNVAGLSLFPDRLIGTAALLRVLARRELTLDRLGSIDWLLLSAYNYAALVWVLRASEVAAAQVGSAVDPTVNYLALRALIHDLDDVRWLLRGLAVLLIPFTLLVSLERVTGTSAFAFVGGNWAFAFRNGTARCQGSFRHAVLLGSVAASFLPLYIGLWAGATRRTVAWLGAALCLIIVALSNSGGPLTSAAAAGFAWVMWPFRQRMGLVRLAGLVSLIVLAVVMKAPIWYLPFKISGLVGGSGWHRAVLLERSWQHLGEWWLVGMDIRDTASWLPYWSDTTGGADVTNQFLVIGLQAGLPAMALFAAVLVLAFGKLGTTLSRVRARGEDARSDQLLLWALGAALAVHAVSWFGVSYFDQSNIVWLMHLAAVASATTTALATAPATVASTMKRTSARGDTLRGRRSLASGPISSRPVS